MPVDVFLKIDGIEGESTDAKHSGALEVEAFAWGVEQAGGQTGGAGGGAGKAAFRSLHVVARTSRASPRLFVACASGLHLQGATLTVRRGGRGQLEFLVVRLTDVVVSAYEIGYSPDLDAPTDEIELGYAKIELDYRPQNADGTLAAVVKGGWDVNAGKSI
jgi:type VI secretion system secreted protein Hcp